MTLIRNTNAFVGRLLFVCVFVCSFFVSSAQMREIHVESQPANQIKKICMYSPNEGYMAFSGWVGYTTDSGRTFVQKPVTVNNVDWNGFSNINVTFGFEINGVYAFDKDNIIVYGDYGLVPAILTSSNGGNSFRLVYHNQYDPYNLRTGVMDMAFPGGGNTGFAVDADRILKTTDKGQTWSLAWFTGSQYLDHIVPASSDIIYFHSASKAGSYFYQTSDAGAHFTILSGAPFSGSSVLALDFLTVNTGWANILTSDGKVGLYKTSDAGAHWNLQNDPSVTPFYCTKMQFTDEATGYALRDTFEVYKTRNSGVTWEPLPRDNSFTYFGYSNNDLFCWSGDLLWAGGYSGFLQISHNGGGTPLPKAYFKVDTTGVFTTNNTALINYSQTGYQYEWYVNGQSVGNSYNANYRHDITRGVDTITLINRAGTVADTLTRIQYFFVPRLPHLYSFSPAVGSTGTAVRVKGWGFTNVTGVSIGGTPAVSFTIQGDTLVEAIVGTGSSGDISLQDVHSRYAISGFTYLAPASGPVLVISGFSPGDGPIGTTVTITGSGFNASAAQNAVYFGSIQAKVLTASTSVITCVVPAGASYDRITVLNKSNGKSGQSMLSFNITFAEAMNFTTHSFVHAQYVTPFEGRKMIERPITQDFDGDGKPDLCANVSNGYSYICRNTSTPGNISFDPPSPPVGNYFFVGGFNIADDLDGDGKPDIATCYGNISVARNTSTAGHISFDTAQTFNVSNSSVTMISADLDNDGKKELVFSCFDRDRLAIMKNTSSPGYLSFGKIQQWSSVMPLDNFAAGDLDGDGFNDLVILTNDYSSVTHLMVLRNTTTDTISFSDTLNLPVEKRASLYHTMFIADYDRDGKPDLVYFDERKIHVYRNLSTKGKLSFASAVTMNDPYTLSDIFLGNFTGHPKPDIIASRFFWLGTIYQYLNGSVPGNAVIDSLVDVSDDFGYSLSMADFDGDGKPDLATSDYNLTRINVLRNNVGVPVDFGICTESRYGYDLSVDVKGKSYRWQIDKGAGFTDLVDGDSLQGVQTATLHFSHTPASWDRFRFRCVADTVFSSIFLLHVTPTVHPSMPLVASDTAICYGKTVTFTGKTNADSLKYGYSMGWSVNGIDSGYTRVDGTNGTAVYSSTLHDGDKVKYVLQYYDACNNWHVDTSKIITMHVNQVPASVQLVATDTLICQGTTVTIAASPVNPGDNPVYHWLVNGVSKDIEGASYTSNSIYDGTRLQLYMNSSLQCTDYAVSNVVTIHVKDTAMPSFQIVATSERICTGTDVTIYGTADHLQGPITHQWTLNGVPFSTDGLIESRNFKNNDQIQCVLDHIETCAGVSTLTSNIIQMQVSDPRQASVSISSNATTTCAPLPIVLTAHPVNGGDAPTYQWEKNGYRIQGADSPTYSVSSFNYGDVFTLQMMSNGACVPASFVVSQQLPLNVFASPSVGIEADTTQDPYLLTAFIISGDAPTLRYSWEDSSASHGWQTIQGASSYTLRYSPGDVVAVRAKVMNAVSCVGVSNSVFFSKHAVSADVRHYPDPVTSVLNIENLHTDDPFGSVVIYNSMGVRVLAVSSPGNQSPLVVPVDALSKGRYAVYITTVSGKHYYFAFLKL